MAALRQFTNAEMAERMRVLAQRSAEPDKRWFFHLAQMFEVQAELLDSSRRRIVESRLLLAAIEARAS